MAHFVDARDYVNSASKLGLFRHYLNFLLWRRRFLESFYSQMKTEEDNHPVHHTMSHPVTTTVGLLLLSLSLTCQAEVIMGAKTPEQLAENLGASKLVLSRDELSVLDEVSALPPEYPE